MDMLKGKVALITGAGRGLGREEALAMAKEGCDLVINDLGTEIDKLNKKTNIADHVVDECKELGVRAVANYDSVADFNKAKKMIDQSISEFGKLDIVVNNAGILRDSMIFNMSEDQWDKVIDVHLKGTFNISRHAAAYFRKQGKKDRKRKHQQRIINTSSDSGLLGNVGQSNYGAAKGGIAAFTLIIAQELKKYATVNCVVPSARTRMTTDATPKMAQFMQKKDSSGLDVFDPANFAPLVVYLASDKSKGISGEVFRAIGDKVWIYRGWHTVNVIENDGRPFTSEELSKKIKSELMIDLPVKQTPASVITEIFTKK